VTDPTGAAIAGANVQVENPATGFQRQTTTNNDGNYLVGDLPPGDYTITITSAAFAKVQLKGAAVTATRYGAPMRVCRWRR